MLKRASTLPGKTNTNSSQRLNTVVIASEMDFSEADTRKIVTRMLLIITLFLLPVSGLAGQKGWTDKDGNSIENTENIKSIDGFGGWLLITSDQDWKEKWETPESDIPQFSTAETVRLGEKITILTLYINPKTDLNNRINLSCDIKVTRPDGTLSFDENDLECANEELKGPPGNVRLTYVVIDFIAELTDPYGVWIIEVVLKDRNARIEIPLKSSFELINTSTFTRAQPPLSVKADFT